jgi:hypothetical protein
MSSGQAIETTTSNYRIEPLTTIHPYIHTRSLKNYLMPELPTAVRNNAAKIAAKEKQLSEAKEERIARNPLQIKKDYGKGSAAARKRTQKLNANMDKHLYGGGVVDGLSGLVVSEAHVYTSKVLTSHPRCSTPCRHSLLVYH